MPRLCFLAIWPDILYPSESLSFKLRGQWLRNKFRVTTSTLKQNKQTENGIGQTRRKKHYSALYLISQTRMSWNFHFHMSVYMCGYIIQGFPGGASGKEPACQGRRHKRRGFDPWVRKIPWKRAWQPTPVFFFFFFLENPMDRGAWWATVHRVTKSQTGLKWLNTHTRTHTLYIRLFFFFLFIGV